MTRAHGRFFVLLLFLVLLGALVLRSGRRFFPAGGVAASTNEVNPQTIRQYLELEARETELNQGVWAREILAEECGRVFESLWDSLNATTNRFRVLEAASVGEIITGRFDPPQTMADGIRLQEPAGRGSVWSQSDWKRFLEETERAGWRLEQLEIRHIGFATDQTGQPGQSRFYFRADSTNAGREERATIEGDLIVDWGPKPAGAEFPAVKRIDASGLTLKTRRGLPPFRLVLAERIDPPEQSFFIDPLILYDLDGDGLSEIILVAKNLVYRRRGENRYEPEPLCRHSPGLVFTGVIADFDGDGAADLLCAKFEGLVLLRGSDRGTFDEPARLVWPANPHLKYGQVLTCGDVNGDGSLDVWIGQYKVPYTRGQMPTPYDDANDGNPAYLLLNDGRGNFTDATDAAGLGKKRWRRTYSASLVDLDHDGDLDLMVVSDFAGTDFYRNDGRGHFTDVTEQWLDESHAAGMAHTFADFNRDGLLDLLVNGMHSPAADRLARLGLSRPGVPDDAARRTQLMHGNRLYLGQRAGGFRQGAPSDSISRSGWSWGCSAFDFDNDGYPDVYIGNGHETRQSVRDYESEVWLHDVYVGSSRDDEVLAAYFGAKMARTRGRGYSFGGYEKNRLYLNQHGDSFLEAGHLMGVALEQDCRNVVTDDLDGDGRLDLLVTTFEAWPERKQTLRIYQNTLPQSGNWIGFRFREPGGGVSPVGAQVTLRYGTNSVVQQIVTGDSYRSQHANTVHFGLGEADRVESVEVRGTSGRPVVLREPAINRYHEIALPAGN